MSNWYHFNKKKHEIGHKVLIWISQWLFIDITGYGLVDKITNEGKDFSMEHEIACGSHFIINKESQFL